jgi:hypothetical protein
VKIQLYSLFGSREHKLLECVSYVHRHRMYHSLTALPYRRHIRERRRGAIGALGQLRCRLGRSRGIGTRRRFRQLSTQPLVNTT